MALRYHSTVLTASTLSTKNDLLVNWFLIILICTCSKGNTRRAKGDRTQTLMFIGFVDIGTDEHECVCGSNLTTTPKVMFPNLQRQHVTWQHTPNKTLHACSEAVEFLPGFSCPILHPDPYSMGPEGLLITDVLFDFARSVSSNDGGLM